MSENVYASNAIAAKTIDTLEPTAVYLRHTQTAQVLTTAGNANLIFDYAHYARATIA
jgi:hypothetical protein